MSPGLRCRFALASLAVSLIPACWAGPFSETETPRTNSPLSAFNQSHYTVRNWTVASGLPASTIQCLLQTRDGYLWIGTRAGLVRFNGKDFRTFPGLNCFCLVEDSEGVLWIGSAQGLASWKGGDFEFFAQIDPKHPHTAQEVRVLCSCVQGGVWVNADGLWRVYHGKVWKAANFPPSCSATALHESITGELYAASRNGVFVSSNRDKSDWSLLLNYPYGVNFLAEEPGGALWVAGGGNALIRLKEAKMTGYTNTENMSAVESVGIDQTGGIWLGADTGLWKLRNQQLEHFANGEGMKFGRINCLLFDHEGNLWIGTEDNGLFCVHRQCFYTYTTRDGLAGDDVWSITQARDGSLWVAAKTGVSHLSDGNFVTYRPEGEKLDSDPVPYGFKVVVEDPKGRIWAGSLGGGLVVSGNELVALKNESPLLPLSSAYSKNHGGCWFIWGPNLLIDFGNAVWSRGYLTHPEAGKANLLGVVQDSSGSLWVGSLNHGLFHVQKEKTARLTQSEGLTSNLVAPVLADADGTIWVVSDKGLNRLKDGKITRYTTAEGLAENLILNVIEDDQGWFWLNGHRGIYRVQRHQLEALAEGKLPVLDCVTYGLEDGLLSAEGNGGTFPNSCKTTDGRLCFPTTKGLAVVDPQQTGFDAIPPPVVIESVHADGEEVYNSAKCLSLGMSGLNLAASQSEQQLTPHGFGSQSGELRLRPGHADSLEFSFTANTLLRTERVQFRYRLANRKADWTPLTSQTSAQLHDLSPGHYRLQVTACNSHGVWNPVGAELAFYVTPFFYQTWVFYSGCFTGTALLLGSFLAYRAHVHRRIVALEKESAVARERERIARDIHDDLGGNLTRIAMLSEAARKDPEASIGSGKPLETVAAISRQVLDNIGELVWATNSKYDTVDSLAAYFREYAAQFFSASSATICHLDFPMNPPATRLSPEFRRQLFLVFKEALNNVAKHARATRVEITFALAADIIELAISDNGQGTASAESPPGHYGLANMRERIVNLGGTFTLVSQPGLGTRVSLRVPLPKKHGLETRSKE